MDLNVLKEGRDRFGIPLSYATLMTVPYFRPAEYSTEIRYLKERSAALGGSMPQRKSEFVSLKIPAIKVLDSLLKGSGNREISTTMAFVMILSALVKDKNIGDRIVPIVPDEARTF